MDAPAAPVISIVPAASADLAALAAEGRSWVLVHGGSAETNRVAEQLGHPPQFVTSVSGYTSRRTDRRTLEIFEDMPVGEQLAFQVQLQRATAEAWRLLAEQSPGHVRGVLIECSYREEKTAAVLEALAPAAAEA